jgi:hypothetical protein
MTIIVEHAQLRLDGRQTVTAFQRQHLAVVAAGLARSVSAHLVRPAQRHLFAGFQVGGRHLAAKLEQ